MKRGVRLNGKHSTTKPARARLHGSERILLMGAGGKSKVENCIADLHEMGGYMV